MEMNPSSTAATTAPASQTDSRLSKRLDAFPRANELTFQSYGLRIGLRANKPGALGQLIERLPPGWKPIRAGVVDKLYSLIVGDAAGAPRRYSFLYAGPRHGGQALRLLQTMDMAKLVKVFEDDLHLYVATYARRRLFVHAGVVGVNGHAILLPGRSLAGKSTLVFALMQAGATVYSDEFAVLDSRGYVHPYARPLSLRSPGGWWRSRLISRALATAGRLWRPPGGPIPARRAGQCWNL